MSHIIYADNAATTKISKEVLDSMMPFLTEEYGNPSSLYSLGRNAKRAIETAREKIAKQINANSNEVFFTSGGSEANNWAIKSVALNKAALGKKHIISSKFEHHAVLHTLDALQKQGFEITYLDVYENGIVKVEDLKNAIREDTALVTIMYANNEIGTIQPIKELGQICKEHNITFHTDAVQAVGNVPIDVVDQNIDLLSISAHKLHGPKGCGCLFVKRGIKMQNLIDGGAQERGRRAGTENVASIVGFAKAIEIACSNMSERNARIIKLRDKLIDSALKIDKSILNGDRKNRLPGNINMCFLGIEGESLLLSLDLKGVCASSGSACTSGSLDPSHVLLAIGLPHEVAHGSLRISLSDDNSEEDVDYIIEVLPPIIEKLRAMSPLWEKIIKESN